MFDPSTQERTYQDIRDILSKNRVGFKESSETYPDGKFKRFTVETI